MENNLNEVSELQQLICSHAKKGGDRWQTNMLESIRHKIPKHNHYKIDIIIKCLDIEEILKNNKKRGVYCGSGETI